MRKKYTFPNMAALIKPPRLKKGLSQAELSHLLGYKNGQFISNCDRALCTIPKRRILETCRLLDIPHSVLKQAYLADVEKHLDEALGLSTKMETNHLTSSATVI